jgi:hypothetical protein
MSSARLRSGLAILTGSSTMRTLWLSLVAALVVIFAPTPAARAGEPIDLKVLYAGNPGSDREKDFRAFLAGHFTRIGTVDYRKFTEQDAKGYDVVIVDWTSIYARDAQGKMKQGDEMSISTPKGMKLDEGYSRPTILIGAAGATATRPLKLKIDWL